MLLVPWLLFNLFAVAALAADLRLFARPARMRTALARTALWIAFATAFASLVFFWQGRQAALEFFTGYILEFSLSVDNLFLFLVIFRFFSVPEAEQQGVLFWGILSAMLMRACFILAGVALLQHVHWIFYFLGGLLVYSGIRLGFAGTHHVDPAANPVVRIVRRLLPVTDSYSDGRFFVSNWQGRAGLYATPLLIVLIVIETTDLLFAVDSIPAVLAVTLNTFIVYTSNVFAILGLRSLYFAVSGLIRLFRFLNAGLAVILVLIGLKMIIASRLPIPTHVTLLAVAVILTISIAASLMFPAKTG